MMAKGDKKFLKTVKTKKFVKRRPSSMGQKNIQFYLVPAKGISTTDVLTGKFRSTPKQLKPKRTFAPVSGKMEMLR
mgnify:CR=1 FL=1